MESKIEIKPGDRVRHKNDKNMRGVVLTSNPMSEQWENVIVQWDNGSFDSYSPSILEKLDTREEALKDIEELFVRAKDHVLGIQICAIEIQRLAEKHSIDITPYEKEIEEQLKG
jgi:sugar phosphate isomerase/epimerase